MIRRIKLSFFILFVVLPWCVEIITGDYKFDNNNDGNLKVDISYQYNLNDTIVDESNLRHEQYKKPLTTYQLGEHAVNKCFIRLDSIIVQNTEYNAWTGRIIVTKYGLKKDLICIEGCINGWSLYDDWIDVDGDASSKTHARHSPQCLNGNPCKIVPEKNGKRS